MTTKMWKYGYTTRNLLGILVVVVTVLSMTVVVFSYLSGWSR